MKSTDKFLIGIVAAIVILVIAALIITLSRPEPTYQAEDTPEGVVHNYLLALNNEEYDLAHGYLSPDLAGYPVSAGKFAEHVQEFSWNFRLNTDTTLTVESAKITGSHGKVKVRESHFRGGYLLESSQSIWSFDIKLRFEEGAWKIVDGDYYFAYCWKEGRGCQ